jgi:hypothetical protein
MRHSPGRLGPFVAVLLLVNLSAVSRSTKNACALLTKAEVEAALDEAVTDPQERVVSVGDGNLAAVSTCSFRSAHPASATTAKSVSLMARYSPAPNKNAATEVRATLAQSGQTVKDVAGVGDAAIWTFRPVGRNATGQLNVFQKGTVYLIVTVSGITVESAALDRAKTLGLAALRKL